MSLADQTQTDSSIQGPEYRQYCMDNPGFARGRHVSEQSHAVGQDMSVAVQSVML